MLQVFLAHPGGPLRAKKDLGAWSIPKGEFNHAEEEALAAAQREFAEDRAAETRVESAAGAVAVGRRSSCCRRLSP
jgi:predicted NUDIX family NTP pyrophosphohydrolase